MKSVKQIKEQIRHCFALVYELNHDWDEYYNKIRMAIDNVCMKQYGYHSHSKELMRYLKNHPELY